MSKLVLLRHGQSLWNKEGRFTGWTDIDISLEGREEAKAAGRLMRSCGITFDLAYTSVLKRAIRTLWIVLDEMDLMWIPASPSWRLNERFYGDLQGKSKRETEEKYGREQVQRWRRSFLDLPPTLPEDDERSPRHDPRYQGLAEDQFPRTESLRDTSKRMLPCWQGQIAPQLQQGKSVFVASHGNTLRALVKHLEDISDEEIENVEIPTGVPLVYELDDLLRPKARYYLHSFEDSLKKCGGWREELGGI